MKNKQKETAILLVILPLIASLCFLVWLIQTDMFHGTEVVSENSIWDLREVNLDKKYVKTVGDKMEYVRNELLTPEEFAASKNIQLGRPEGKDLYLTGRLHLLVPEGRTYAIVMDSPEFAGRIYINGERVQDIGRPGKSREEMIPKTTKLYYTVRPVNGVIEIVQQTSNFVHREGGAPMHLEIGGIEVTKSRFVRSFSMAAMFMGTCMILFLVHMLLYLLLKVSRASLYFALLCLAWLIRTALTGPKVSPTMFTTVSWEFWFRLEYISVPLTGLLLFLALGALFKGLVQRWVRKLTIALQVAFMGLYLVLDTVTMSYCLMGSYLLSVVLVVYVIIRFLMLMNKHRTIEQKIVVSGLLIFSYTVIRDILQYNKIKIFPTFGGSIMEWALLVFIMFLMTATFYSTMRQFRETQKMGQRLAMENAALDHVNTLKNELMADLTHEMRTPLTVMSTYAQLAVRTLRQKDFDEQTVADLDTISQEAQRLAEMASGVLDVFKKKEKAFAPTNVEIDAVVHQTERLFALVLKKKRNRMLLDVPDNLPQVRCNINEFTQILWNLITNANTYTSEGEIVVGVRQTENRLLVSVTDTGEGIEPELLPYVFERNRHGEKKGSGLGLSICREIVEAYGGDIMISSELGKGTAVKFWLPVVPDETEEKGEEEKDEAGVNFTD